MLAGCSLVPVVAVVSGAPAVLPAPVALEALVVLAGCSLALAVAVVSGVPAVKVSMPAGSTALMPTRPGTLGLTAVTAALVVTAVTAVTAVLLVPVVYSSAAPAISVPVATVVPVVTPMVVTAVTAQQAVKDLTMALAATGVTVVPPASAGLAVPVVPAL